MINKVFILSLFLITVSAYGTSKKILTLEKGESLSPYAIITAPGKEVPSYFLKIKSKNSFRIVSSDGNYGSFQKILQTVFSSDRKQWAFIAKQGNKQTLYLSQKTNFGSFQSFGTVKINMNNTIFSATTTNGSFLYILSSSSNVTVTLPKIQTITTTNISGNASNGFVTNISTQTTTNLQKKTYPIGKVPQLTSTSTVTTNSIQKNEIKGPYKAISEYVISTDGSHYAYLAKTSKGWFLFDENGKENGPYSAVSKLEMSTNGNLLTFCGVKSFLWSKASERVINGRAYGAFDEIGDLVSDSQSKKWIFPARKDKQWFFISSDDTRLGPFDEIQAPYFSPMESEWIAAGKSKDGWEVFFRNQQKFGPYPKVGLPIFSRDDSHWFLRFHKNSGWYILFKDKTLYGPYKKIGSLAMNDSWDQMAIPILREDGIYVIFKDGQEFGPYENSETNRKWLSVPVSFSPSGKDWYFRALKLDGKIIVINGKEYGPFEFSTLPVYSPNEKIWAFWAGGEDHKYHLNLSAGKSKLSFINIDYLSPYFSDDGKKWFFKAEDFDGWYLIDQNGKKQGPSISEPSLTLKNNLNHWILILSDKNMKYQIITSDKKKYGPYDNAFFPVLSSSGKSWAVTVEKEGVQTLLLNGKEHPNIRTFKTFSTKNKDIFCWFENKNGKILIHRQEVK